MLMKNNIKISSNPHMTSNVIVAPLTPPPPLPAKKKSIENRTKSLALFCALAH